MKQATLTYFAEQAEKPAELDDQPPLTFDDGLKIFEEIDKLNELPIPTEQKSSMESNQDTFSEAKFPNSAGKEAKNNRKGAFSGSNREVLK